MRFRKTPLYTQTKNSCTITTIQNLWRAKYGIILNEEQSQRMKDDAEKSWIWSENSWAIFRFVYNWATGWFYKEYWVEIDVEEFSILSDDFEVRSMQWEWWGIWLLYASKWNREAIADQEITLEEIEAFNKKDNQFMGHNQFWKLNYIAWILRSIAYWKKFIKFDIKALREAVKKWLYWETARCFTMNDKLLEYYLIELNRGTIFNYIERLDKKHRTKLDLAMKLRILKK